MRRIRASFWTSERIRRLQALEAAGLSAREIAEKLGTTRKAVIGRSQRLRGLTYTFASYINKERDRRAATQTRRRERERRSRAAIARMRAEISNGTALSFGRVASGCSFGANVAFGCALME